MSGYDGFGRNDFIVAPRSWAAIDREADFIRRKLGFSRKSAFPVIETLEKVLDQQLGLIELQIEPREVLENTEGLTSSDGKRIFLREDVYLSAWRGGKRARFTVAHELGHWALHSGQSVSLARNATANVEAYRLSEPQANRFASALLMPFQHFHPAISLRDVQQIFGVSKSAAEIRLAEYRKSIVSGGCDLFSDSAPTDEGT